jgi:hypothetical protein
MVDGKVNDLCHFGSQHIQADLPAILNVYKSYAQGYAACYGTTRPIIFEMEPDWYQYTDPNQNDPMTKEEAGKILAQYVDAIRSALPNAYFSIDVSPWVDDNGETNGKDWYSHFDLSKFTFVNTSGGSTLGANAKIRNDNLMTWAGVSQVTGKGVLADTGYGANGISAGHELGQRRQPERALGGRRHFDQPVQSEERLGKYDQEYSQPAEDAEVLPVARFGPHRKGGAFQRQSACVSQASSGLRPMAVSSR